MRNIVLIGFMGSGKTAVSRELAKITGMKVVDTDEMVEKRARRKIKNIFEQDGEEYFRRLESAAAKKAAKKKNAVIATGGGIVKKPENMKALGKNGFIVYLKNSFKTSYERVKDDSSRPLFNAKNLEGFRRLFKERVPVYTGFAEMTVKTDRLSVRQAAEAVIKKAGMKLG